MAANAMSQQYLADKQNFFSTVTDKKALSHISIARERAMDKNYAYVARYLPNLEQEFNHIFDALKEDGENRDKFWYYCFYCSILLETYYRTYGKNALADKYKAISEEIDARYQADKLAKAKKKKLTEEQELNQYKNKLIAGLCEILSTPLHSSKIKELAGLTNIVRMQIVFGKICVNTSLLMIKQSEMFCKLFGQNRIDSMLRNLDNTTGVLNVLSVAVFAVRFAMNAGALIKHTFFPNDEEAKLPLKARFSKELGKRHCDMMNDLVWGTVNLLTNYSKYFNISASAAGNIMSVFLVFDICMLLHRRDLAFNEYQSLKTQYELEKDKATAPDDIKMLEEQLEKLEEQWKVNSATLWFYVTAAVLLMSGFSASMMITSPIVLPFAFLTCTLAIAMYISGGSYGEYTQKQLVVDKKRANGEDTADAEQMVSDAKGNLIKDLAKNAIIPTLFMGVFAFSWPAAIALVVLFIGYEMICSGKPSDAKNSDENDSLAYYDSSNDEYLEDDSKEAAIYLT